MGLTACFGGSSTHLASSTFTLPHDMGNFARLKLSLRGRALHIPSATRPSVTIKPLVASPTYFNMFRHAAEPRSSERERLNSMFVGRGAHQLARLRPRVFRLTTISSNMDKRTHCNNKLLRLPKKSKPSCSKQQKCPPSAGRNTPMNCSFHTFVLTLYSNGTYSTPLQFSLNPTVAFLRLLSQEMLTQDSPKEDSATFGKSVKVSLKL